MRNRLSALLVAVAAAAAFLAMPSQAHAQAPAQPQQEVQEIPSAELESFAEAYLEVAEVRRAFQNRLQQANDPEVANQIQQEANQEMTAVLTDHGIEVERYTEITQVLNVDAEQRAEFESIVEELQEEGGPSGLLLL